MSRTFAYARVSTADQEPGNQIMGFIPTNVPNVPQDLLRLDARAEARMATPEGRRPAGSMFRRCA